MPGGDGTGPMGMGPMTGRAMGYCAGYPMPGYANPGGGQGLWRGFGRGRGFRGRGGGRGWRNMFYATGLPGWLRFGAFGWPSGAFPRYFGGAAPYAAAPEPEMEKQALKAQADFLEESLASIKKRLNELETTASET